MTRVVESQVLLTERSPQRLCAVSRTGGRTEHASTRPCHRGLPPRPRERPTVGRQTERANKRKQRGQERPCRTEAEKGSENGHLNAVRSLVFTGEILTFLASLPGPQLQEKFLPFLSIFILLSWIKKKKNLEPSLSQWGRVCSRTKHHALSEMQRGPL